MKGARNPKYARQYENYDWHKQHKICVNCGNDNACVNSIYCPECGEKKREQNKKYASEHREENKKRCSEYNKKIYAERKEKGLCTKCGKHKVIHGHALCLSCKVKKDRRKDPRYNNEFDRSIRNGLGLCYVCAKPLNRYDKLCDDCYDRASKTMKKTNANPTEKMIKARKEYTDYYKRFKNSIFQKRKPQ